ncbi:unnamed protein product [Soboliphyme baturini]|uniref:HTH La-type RNA-binding domain-containing protein n=1 Tax=Soboliphyme baturini TaxID=241478 RepID=A0A183IXP5_9BILA|nr:unnamed protein product [Soboliphyme baturini]
MKSEIEKSEGIPVSKLMTFNRLKKLSDDQSMVLAALRKSTSGLLEIDEAESRIRRSPLKPLPADPAKHWQTVRMRTAYVVSNPIMLKLDLVFELLLRFGIVYRKVFQKTAP